MSSNGDYIFLFKTNSTSVSLINKELYIKFIEKYCIDNSTSIHDLAMHPEKIVEILSNYDSLKPTTITSYLRKIYTLIKFNPIVFENNNLLIRWRICIDKSDAGRKVKELNNIASENEIAKYVPYDTCLSILKNMPDEFIQTKVLFGVYLLIPPVRNDYWNCRIISNDDQDQVITSNYNYIEIHKDGKMTFHINQYKTSKIYGPIITPCPDELSNIISKSLIQLPRTHLFIRGDGSPYKTGCEFTAWANARISACTNNKTMSILTFRHVFLSRMEIKTKTPIELFELSKQMGHSLITQHRYIWDIDE